MRFTRFLASSFIAASVYFSAAISVQAVEPCDVSTGLLDMFPRAFCSVNSPSGTPGGPIEINVPLTKFIVPDNPNPAGRDDLDVFVLHRYPITAPPAFFYSSTYRWDRPTPVKEITFYESVLNLPLDIPVTHVNALNPANEIAPAEFSWLLNDQGLAVGAQFNNRVIPGLPPEMPFIDIYHFQIAGLPAGTEVQYEKVVGGGAVVVPEPASSATMLLGLVGLISGVCRRRA